METITEARPKLRRNPARLRAVHQAVRAEVHTNRELDSTLIHAVELDDFPSLYRYLAFCGLPKISKSLGKERHAYLMEMRRLGRPVTDFFWTMVLAGGDSGEFDSES